MTRPTRTPLRERIPRDPNGQNHTVEGDPGYVSRAHTTERHSEITPTSIAPAPVDAYRARIQADQTWARHIAVSQMLPETYQDKPANIAWAIGYARALNIPVMAALQGVYLSKDGKPALVTQLMHALVLRAGHKVRVWVDNPDGRLTLDTTTTAQIIRSDDLDFTFQATWTFARAQQAGLMTVNNGRILARSHSGHAMPWERYPEAMLKARSLSEVIREACPDALFGVSAYTPEELGADVDEEGHPLTTGADGAGFDTIEIGQDLTGFDGPDLGEFDGPELEDEHPDTQPQEQEFNPASADLNQWSDRISEAAERGDRGALTTMWHQAAQHRNSDNDLLSLFHQARQDLSENEHNNPF